jgi:hypothetical protein
VLRSHITVSVPTATVFKYSGNNFCFSEQYSYNKIFTESLGPLIHVCTNASQNPCLVAMLIRFASFLLYVPLRRISSQFAYSFICVVSIHPLAFFPILSHIYLRERGMKGCIHSRVSCNHFVSQCYKSYLELLTSQIKKAICSNAIGLSSKVKLFLCLTN